MAEDIKSKIFGEEKKVKASIEIISGMSAHADEPELLKFIAEGEIKNQIGLMK